VKKQIIWINTNTNTVVTYLLKAKTITTMRIMAPRRPNTTPRIIPDGIIIN